MTRNDSCDACGAYGGHVMVLCDGCVERESSVRVDKLKARIVELQHHYLDLQNGVDRSKVWWQIAGLKEALDLLEH